MPEDFRNKSAELIKSFQAKRDKLRAEKDKEAERRKSFFDQFESKVNGAITEHVSDLLGSLDGSNDITVSPKGDPERSWYEVTISAIYDDGKKKSCTVRFSADYDTLTISTQRPEASGRYANINGDVTLPNFNTSLVSRALYNCLESVLRD